MNLDRVAVTPKNQADWLAMREKDLTSTEVSALFKASPYMTEYSLYQRKKGELKDDFKTNARMIWGNRLEAAIAAGVAEDYGLLVEPFKTYVRIPELRLGASFDFKIVGLSEAYEGDDENLRKMFLQHGVGILEIKNVDGLQFKRGWVDDEHAGVEAPPHIEFQIQHQMLVAGIGWAAGAALVGGNNPVVFTRVYDEAIGGHILAKAAKFWGEFDADIQPEPDFKKDAELIANMYVENDGSSIDLSDDPRVFELCKRYKDNKAVIKDAEEEASAAKAELLTIVKSAKSVDAAGYKISAGTNKESHRFYTRSESERVTITISKVPAADIEATVSPFRNVRITEKK